MPAAARPVDARAGTGTLDPDVETFCAEVHPRLVGSLVLLCGDHGVAEELAQDTLVRVIERWDRVRRMDHPVSWAHRVAYNLASSHFRRRSAERRANQRHGVDGEGHPGPDVAAVLTVRDALRHLPERQRCAVVLRYLADLPVADVAAEMGITPGSVKVMTSRGLAGLREQLGDQIAPVPATVAPAAPDMAGLARRARRRQAVRRAGVAVGALVLLLVASVGLPRMLERRDMPVVDLPLDLRVPRWEAPVDLGFAPVSHDFLPATPLVEAGGLLWTPGNGPDVVARTTEGTVVERTEVGDGAGATVCHLESTPDDQVLGIVCAPGDAGEVAQPASAFLVDPEAPGAPAVVDRAPWNAPGDVVEHQDGVIWFAAVTELVGVDLATGAEQVVDLPSGVRARALASGFGDLWVTTSSAADTPDSATGELLRVRSDGTLVDRIPLGSAAAAAGAPAAVQHTPLAVLVGPERVWVELAGEGRVAGVDPADPADVVMVDLGEPPTGGRTPTASGRSVPLRDDGRLWVLVGQHVLLVDPTTGRVVTDARAPVADPSHVSGATVTADGDVWFGDWYSDRTFRLPAS